MALPRPAVRRRWWFALVPLALASPLPGCGGSAVEDKKVYTEQPPEIEEANKNMEDFMKQQGSQP